MCQKYCYFIFEAIFSEMLDLFTNKFSAYLHDNIKVLFVYLIYGSINKYGH